MEIKLPKRTEDLRLRHYNVITNPAYQREMDLALIVDFLSDFTGIPKGQIKQIDYKDCLKMYSHISKLYNGYKPQQPPQKITVKDKEYQLIDPHKVSTGWHIDFSNTDTKKEHIRLACLFYYPVDSKYGDVDENDNLIYPIESRYYDFQDEFPLTVYLDASAFFLSRSKILIDVSMVRLKLKKWIRENRLIRLINGKSQSIA